MEHVVRWRPVSKSSAAHDTPCDSTGDAGWAGEVTLILRGVPAGGAGPRTAARRWEPESREGPPWVGGPCDETEKERAGRVAMA